MAVWTFYLIYAWNKDETCELQTCLCVFWHRCLILQCGKKTFLGTSRLKQQGDTKVWIVKKESCTFSLILFVRTICVSFTLTPLCLKIARESGGCVCRNINCTNSPYVLICFLSLVCEGSISASFFHFYAARALLLFPECQTQAALNCIGPHSCGKQMLWITYCAITYSVWAFLQLWLRSLWNQMKDALQP